MVCSKALKNNDRLVISKPKTKRAQGRQGIAGIAECDLHHHRLLSLHEQLLIKGHTEPDRRQGCQGITSVSQSYLQHGLLPFL